MPRHRKPRTPKPRRWSPPEVAFLTEADPHGVRPVGRIARFMGRSSMSIWMKLGRLRKKAVREVNLTKLPLTTLLELANEVR